MRYHPRERDVMAAEPAEYRNTELFFGVVAPVGTDLTSLTSTLSTHLARFRYQTTILKLSDFLRDQEVATKHGVTLKLAPEAARLNSFMDAGNELRRLTGMNDVLALYAASQVSQRRRLSNVCLDAADH